MAADDNQDDAPEAPRPDTFVDGINAIQYAKWRNDPVTLMFRKYLSDFRLDAIEATTEQWLAGKTELAEEHERRGYCRALFEASDLSFDLIATFYHQIRQKVDAIERADRPQTEEAIDEGTAAS